MERSSCSVTSHDPRPPTLDKGPGKWCSLPLHQSDPVRLGFGAQDQVLGGAAARGEVLGWRTCGMVKGGMSCSRKKLERFSLDKVG